jgi:hypothetical protein
VTPRQAFGKGCKSERSKSVLFRNGRASLPVRRLVPWTSAGDLHQVFRRLFA